jgi:hypothetical protein
MNFRDFMSGGRMEKTPWRLPSERLPWMKVQYPAREPVCGHSRITKATLLATRVEPQRQFVLSSVSDPRLRI